jgi:hypothetical protein
MGDITKVDKLLRELKWNWKLKKCRVVMAEIKLQCQEEEEEEV